MAQPRFFQHLNENDPDFQKVTTLEYIDNSDGMNLYYFKDGSKCNKSFIAPVNSLSIEGFEFAEVSNPYNIWKLNKVVPTIDEPQTMVGADGNVYEVPTYEDYTNSHVERKTRVDVISRPAKIDNYQIPNDNDYSIKAYMEAKKLKDGNTPKEVKNEKSFDFNDTNKVALPETKKESVQNIVSSVKADTLYINLKEIMKNINNVEFIFENGNHYAMTVEEFVDNALTPKEEKVVEKVVEKEVVVKSSDSDIDLGLDSVQKGLLDNMIDMSNKIEYPIDIELTLNLPPANVYKLIKSVYPSGMDKGFVNILANRMQVKELKTAVADGLLAFYNEDIEIEQEIKDEQKPAKKSSSKKIVEK